MNPQSQTDSAPTHTPGYKSNRQGQLVQLWMRFRRPKLLSHIVVTRGLVFMATPMNYYAPVFVEQNGVNCPDI